MADDRLFQHYPPKAAALRWAIAHITNASPAFEVQWWCTMDHTPALQKQQIRKIRRLLLLCGIGAACIYILTDIAASAAYPGFSYTNQAVSELFAIGAPTSWFVVPLFTISSALVLLFAFGIAIDGHRTSRLLALMFAGSALDALALWNFFPMHMRGAQRTFTDTMHLILATNPFVLGTLVVSVFAFRGRFRWLSLGTLLTILMLGVFGFHYASAVDAGRPTPGLGLSERLGQYIYDAWQAGLALLLLDTRAGRIRH